MSDNLFDKNKPPPQIMYKEGDIIFREGASSREMYILLSGMVKIVKQQFGHEHVLAEVKESQVFGEMSFIDGAPRSASARVASEEAVLYVLEYEVLKKSMNSLPAWLKPIILTIIDRVKQNNKVIQRLERELKKLDLKEQMKD